MTPILPIAKPSKVWSPAIRGTGGGTVCSVPFGDEKAFLAARDIPKPFPDHSGYYTPEYRANATWANIQGVHWLGHHVFRVQFRIENLTWSRSNSKLRVTSVDKKAETGVTFELSPYAANKFFDRLADDRLKLIANPAPGIFGADIFFEKVGDAIQAVLYEAPDTERRT